MKMPARVLVIGKDEAPVAGIATVLGHFWDIRTMVRTLGPEIIEGFLKEEELIVLCDSFTEDERQAWVDHIRTFSATLLVVKINGYDSGPHAGADATVDYDHGPGALVSTIYELLTERGLGSRAWVETADSAWVQ
jgi:hypothetical protein